MRIDRAVFYVLVLAVAVSGCKKRPKPDLPLKENCASVAAGGNLVSPQATQFHQILQCTDTLSTVKGFYAAELVTKRGWTQRGDTFFLGDNMEHAGDVGRSGSVSVRDPTQPGGWVAVIELPNFVLVDLWQSVPEASAR